VGASKLLGEFDGILCTHRHAAYSHWDMQRRQLCWAHALRFFEWMAQSCVPSTRAIGERLESAARAMLHAWNEVKRGTLERVRFDEQLPGWKQTIDLALLAGVGETARKTGSDCGDTRVT